MTPEKPIEVSTPRPSDSDDWIAAPATAPGLGAIAIVRLDGPGCWRAAARVWRPLFSAEEAQSDLPPPGSASPRSAMPGSASSDRPPEPRRMTLGKLAAADGEDLDDALAAWFPAPHSYTGNDLVEFHCHGSPAVVAALVDALLAAGARLARPGEFTERAFFNGRIDLAQAEGVANLIAARTHAAGKAALTQLRGVLSEEILAVRDTLVDLAAEIEARLDFPEEEIEKEDARRLLETFETSEKRLEALLTTARRGRLFRDGARVAIAGKPNTGKSSLFNSLVGMERALVTPHPGTTRDTIEATVDIRGIPVVLIDTAGVRHEGAEEIESLGIERTLREIEAADLVLFVLDVSTEPDSGDRKILSAVGEKPKILVANKNDVEPSVDDTTLLELLNRNDGDASPSTPLPNPMRVCALEPATLQPLERAIEENLLGKAAGENKPADAAAKTPALAERESPTVINQRHEERLRAALEALRRSRENFASGASGEFTVVDLNEALHALSEIVGLSIDDAVLSRIFSRFCIGK